MVNVTEVYLKLTKSSFEIHQTKKNLYTCKGNNWSLENQDLRLCTYPSRPYQKGQ
jgi:hypothetical protein